MVGNRINTAVKRLRVLVLELSGQITTSVFTKVDLQGLVVFERLDAVDGLDGIGDVDKVNKGTILFLQVVDLFNICLLYTSRCV